jgi:hypothetical protein
MIVKLKEPIKLGGISGNGQTITELDLKLETLKGSHIIELETGFRRLYRGEYVPVTNLDARYQIMVAGRVSGYNPIELAEALSAPDFVEVTTTVQNFLLGSGSAETTIPAKPTGS